MLLQPKASYGLPVHLKILFLHNCHGSNEQLWRDASVLSLPLPLLNNNHVSLFDISLLATDQMHRMKTKLFIRMARKQSMADLSDAHH